MWIYIVTYCILNTVFNNDEKALGHYYICRTDTVEGRTYEAIKNIPIVEIEKVDSIKIID